MTSDIQPHDHFCDDHARRITIIEERMLNLVTSKQFTELITEFKTLKWVFGGGVVIQIFLKFLGG